MSDTQDHPEIIHRAAALWGINPDAVIKFMLKTVVTGTKHYTPNTTDCIQVLVVAMNYQLNPFTKEIYAFVDKGKIIPVVGVDGWSRIINSRGNFDGADFDMEFDSAGEPVSCTCRLYCKDRRHPVAVTEYMNECYVKPRNGYDGPWQSHPKRMLRHKAFIQAARYAFALSGIYDPDEAGRIVGKDLPAEHGQYQPVSGQTTGDVVDDTPDPLLLEAINGNDVVIDTEANEEPEMVPADGRPVDEDLYSDLETMKAE